MPFAENFNYCMEKRGYSAYKFAQIIGASNQGVLFWQAGKNVPHPKTRQKIADHFGITLAELDGDELPVLPEEGEQTKKAAPTNEGSLDPVTRELFRIIDDSTEDERKQMLEYIEFIRSKRGK